MVVGLRPIKGKQSTIDWRVAIKQTLGQDDVAANVSPVDKSPLLGDCDLRHELPQMESERFAEDLVV